MKPSSIWWMLSILLATFVIIAPSVHAWDQSDFEIFDLVDELEKSEGKGTSFYGWLNLTPNASPSDINRAYRKMSLKVHPDKNKHDAKAKEKFARLGKIVAILRDSSKRERYNFFYKNGVPRWRGTGYYYSRFRPGLGFVSMFLAFLFGLMQYLVGWVNYHQERRRIASFVSDARQALTVNVPKSQGAPTLGRSVIEVAGRAMRCEVKSDTYIIVYPQDDGEPIHLNTEWIQRPSITRNVFLFSWPLSVYRKLTGKKQEEDEEVYEQEDTSEEQEQKEGGGKKKKKVKRAEPVQVTGTKVGGRRRAVRK